MAKITISESAKAIIESNKASNNNDLSYNYYIDICTALQNVKKEYYTFAYHNERKLYERMFAYELYHQIRVIIDDKNKSGNKDYAGVYLNGEPDKSLNIYQDLSKAADTLNKENECQKLNNVFRPDLVLHIPDKTKAQQYIAEIKMLANEDVVSDFIKLTDYIKRLKPKFKMHFLIYIVNSLDNKELEEKLKTKIEKEEINPEDLSRDIICIEASGENDIRTRTLGDILDKIENK